MASSCPSPQSQPNGFIMMNKINSPVSIKDLPCKQESRKLHQQTESFRAWRQLQQIQVQYKLSIYKKRCCYLIYKQNHPQPIGQDSFSSCIKPKSLGPAASTCHHLHHKVQICSISYLVCFPQRILPPSSCYCLGYDQTLFNYIAATSQM